MNNAYSKDTSIEITNSVPVTGYKYSSIKGYKIEPSGKGPCMLGVYNPSSAIARYFSYYKGQGRIAIHYSSSGGCMVRDSVQDFNVINLDTGKIVGQFAWKKPAGKTSRIVMIHNPDNFMSDRTGHTEKELALNIWCN
ncbi:hypothetical protein [Candidatus Sororendozoicomonas aggregata]|uniref:hypothetical protein n=1 Tax=Candidatus Sororendozoicomonas aggregata TaxID=3073239 RepID=UPI002ED5726C